MNERARREVGKSLKMNAQVVILAALVVLFGFAVVNGLKGVAAVDAEIAEVDKDYERELEYAEALKLDASLIWSDEFIRRAAYERWGLVGEEDIVIKKRP